MFGVWVGPSDQAGVRCTSKSFKLNAPPVWPHLQGKRPAWRYTNTHTNINIGGRPPVNYKVHAMFSLTLQRTKDGYTLSLKVDFHQLALALIAVGSFFA